LKDSKKQALNFSLFAAKKIAFQQQKTFSKFIIRLAIVATTISVATMIVALSFVNGFQQAVSKKVFGFWGHIRVQQDLDYKVSIAEEYPITKNDTVLRLLNTFPGVASADEFATKSAILKFNGSIESVLLKGTNEQFHFNRLNAFLKSGHWPAFSKNNYSKDLTLSQYLTNKLSLKIGDSLLVFFFRNDGSKTARKLKLSGIFKTGIEEYDKHFGICDMALIQKLNQWEPDQIGGYEISLQDYTQTDSITKKLYEALPQSWYSRSIQEIFPNIFDWLNLQGQIKDILIIIMAIIAVVNLMTCLIILLLERVSMTGLLKAMGAKDFLIQKIFLFHGLYIALTGIFLGLVLGLGICFAQQQWGFITLDEEAYLISKAEVIINPTQILIVMAITFLSCMITLLLPTLMIRKIKAIKAIRFS
jgi:lipoprotein-releasing system permease protein